MPARICTLQEALAELTPQRFGKTTTYQVDESDAGTRGRALAEVEVPHHLAGPWTVTLGQPSRGRTSIAVGAVNLEASGDIRRGFAIVEWGIGGFSSVAWCDWRQGQTIRVFGNYVKVSSFLPTGPAVDTGGPVTIGASVAPGTCGGPPPTLTKVLQTAGQAEGVITPGTISQPVDIPRFAYEAQFIVSRQQANDTYDILWFRRANTVDVGKYQAGPGGTGSTQLASWWAPIPTEATACAVENTDVNGFLASQLQFRLAL